MAQIIDLTMPIEDHFRWKVEHRLLGDFVQGDQFQITWTGWAVHGFTHMDAPRHMLSEGPTTDDIGLDKTVGPCAVFDLSGIRDNSPISAQMLARSGPEVQAGDIALVKAEWDTRHSYHTEEFWTQAPFMTRQAAQWLLAANFKAVAFDFPQDFPIRLLLEGEVAPIADFVTHDILLRHDVILVEYLCNTAAIKGPRTTLYALPMKIPDADGTPARVVAIED